VKDETKKIESPVCACGRSDLYDEWLKRKEENTSSSVQADKPVSTSEDLNGLEPEQKQPPKENLK
jgi:hypothetical protein